MHRFRVHPKTDPETTLAEGVVWSDRSVDVRGVSARAEPESGSVHFSSMRFWREVLDPKNDIEFIDPPDEDWAEPATAED